MAALAVVGGFVGLDAVATRAQRLNVGDVVRATPSKWDDMVGETRFSERNDLLMCVNPSSGHVDSTAVRLQSRHMPVDRKHISTKAAALAAKGVFVGTSSWKYEGWFGQLYTPSRYEYRGKVATTRFERDCLSEYAEVFKTVCVDAAYYTFPRPEYLHKLADAVPDDFRFGFKVTDEITIKKFPNHPRYGAKAGQPNSDFPNADLFVTAFLKPCEDIRRL